MYLGHHCTLVVVCFVSLLLVWCSQSAPLLYHDLQGECVIFSSNRSGVFQLYEKSTTNFHAVTCLSCDTTSMVNDNATMNLVWPKVSPDGVVLAYLSSPVSTTVAPEKGKLHASVVNLGSELKHQRGVPVSWKDGENGNVTSLDIIMSTTIPLNASGDKYVGLHAIGVAWTNNGTLFFREKTWNNWSWASEDTVPVACASNNMHGSSPSDLQCNHVVSSRTRPLVYYSVTNLTDGNTTIHAMNLSSVSTATVVESPILIGTLSGFLAENVQSIVLSDSEEKLYINVDDDTSSLCVYELSVVDGSLSPQCAASGIQVDVVGANDAFRLHTSADQKQLWLADIHSSSFSSPAMTTLLEFNRATGNNDNATYAGATWATQRMPARRGMYISLYTDKSGPTQFSSDPERFSKYEYIIESEEMIHELLRYVEEHNINALTLYGMSSLLPSRAEKLRAFIKQARAVGVIWIEAVGARSHSKYDEIAAFQNASTEDAEMFDGVVTEIEFWTSSNVAQGATVDWVVEPVTYMRSLYPKSRANRPFYYASYLGWVNATELMTLDTVLDKVFLHAYKDHPEKTWGAVDERMDWVLQNTSMEAHTIFATPASILPATGGSFMGDWFRDQSTPFESAESIFIDNFTSSETFSNFGASRFKGFQYWSYFYTSQNTRNTTATPKRGMYLSLYSDGPGQMVASPDFPSGRFSKHYNILETEAKVQLLLDFITKYHITSLSLYNLHVILRDDDKSDALRSFIARSRMAGVEWVEAIAATALSSWADVATYQNASKVQEEMFDGSVTEIEFWHSTPRAASELLTPVNYMRLLDPTRRPGSLVPFYYNAYVGWITSEEIDELADPNTGIDAFYVHAYVKDPSSSYGYTKSRVNAILQNTTRPVYPIFSTEGVQVRAGGEIFMGDWLAANRSLAAAEDFFTEAFEAAQLPLYHDKLRGFQWYSYFFTEIYLEDVASIGSTIKTTTPTLPVSETPPPTSSDVAPTTTDTAPPPQTTQDSTPTTNVEEPTTADVPVTTADVNATADPTPTTSGEPVTMTPEPPRNASDFKVVRKIMSLAGNSWEQLLNTQLNSLRTAIRSDLSRALGISPKYLWIVDLAIGSLVVEYDIQVTPETDEAALDTQLLASTSGSGSGDSFITSMALYESTTGETLTPQVLSATTVSSTPGAPAPTDAPPVSQPTPDPAASTPAPGPPGGDPPAAVDPEDPTCGTGCIILALLISACFIGGVVAWIVVGGCCKKEKGKKNKDDSTMNEPHGGDQHHQHHQQQPPTAATYDQSYSNAAASPSPQPTGSVYGNGNANYYYETTNNDYTTPQRGYYYTNGNNQA